MPQRPLLALALSLVLAAASYVPYRLLSGRDAERPALTGTAAPAPDPRPAPAQGPDRVALVRPGDLGRQGA